MSDGLKPCPWCGEEHICLFEVQDEDGSAFAVGCVSEDCPGHVAASWRYITREKAIEVWNTRAERTCSYVEHCDGTYNCYQCSECQYEMDGGDFELYRPNYCMDCGAKIEEVVSNAD